MAVRMDSTISSPHLLTIPREIRNQIYKYLHQNLELRGIEYIGPSQVFVKLTSVPYPGVYRVHSRLNAEYHESGPINKLSALIFNRICGDDEQYWSKEEEVVSKDDNALGHAKSATLRFSIGTYVERTDIIDLLNALVPKATGLRTIRIVECAVIRVFYDEPLPKHAEWITEDKIPLLPNVFASLPLIQRANCRWIGTLVVTEPHLRTCEQHLVHQCRTHLYSTRRLSEALWTAFEVVYSDQPRGYIKWRRQLYKHWQIKARSKGERVIAWKEEDCSKHSDDGS